MGVVIETRSKDSFVHELYTQLSLLVCSIKTLAMKNIKAAP